MGSTVVVVGEKVSNCCNVGLGRHSKPLEASGKLLKVKVVFILFLVRVVAFGSSSTGRPEQYGVEVELMPE